MGVQEPVPDVGDLDSDQILEDMITGNVPDTPNKDKLEEVFDDIRGEVMPDASGILTPSLIQQIMEQYLAQNSQNSEELIRQGRNYDSFTVK